MKSPCAGEEESNHAPSKVEEAWSALNDRSLVVMVEQLFFHLLKILNICAHVLDDTPPGPAVKVKKALNRSWLPYCYHISNIYYNGIKSFAISVNLSFQATLPSLSNTPSLSPIRRKSKEKEMMEPSTTPMSPKKGEVNTGSHTCSATCWPYIWIIPLSANKENKSHGVLYYLLIEYLQVSCTVFLYRQSSGQHSDTSG